MLVDEACYVLTQCHPHKYYYRRIRQKCSFGILLLLCKSIYYLCQWTPAIKRFCSIKIRNAYLKIRHNFLRNFPLLAQHLETWQPSQQSLQQEVTWGGMGKGGGQRGNVSSGKTVISLKISLAEWDTSRPADISTLLKRCKQTIGWGLRPLLNQC